MKKVKTHIQAKIIMPGAAGLVLMCVGLAGCTSGMTNDSQSVGSISSSASNGVVYATPKAANTKPRIITKYIPVPVPGQLMPLNQPEFVKGKAPSFLTKAKAVKYANQHAMITPNSRDFFNAMTTYNFMPGALYTIYTAPMRITDIAFQPGERIISDAAGDTLRWQVSQTYSGEGSTMRQHILVKPNQPSLVNTMIVTTNRRVYHLILKSTENGTYMVSTRWHYPSSMVKLSGASASTDSDQSTSSGNSPYTVNLADLHFNYEFGMAKGSKPAWYPVRVYNNNRQTFIQFPKNFYSARTPILYVANNEGKYQTMVNWRLKGNYMVVDGLFKKARLQTGIGKTGQTIVQIQQT